MVPKIHAKFRRRHGVPYAIEQLSGRQFRCRHCNDIFLTEKELDRHVRDVVRSLNKERVKVSSASPKLSTSIDVRVLYTYDILDKMKRQWLKLKKGDEYDGI
jgi:uncharacterized C2H2 Zn-finger protein